MKVFADTAYFIALLNSKDSAHGAAIAYSRQRFSQIILTECVLLELGDGFCEPADRRDYLATDAYIRATPHFRIIPATNDLLRRGRDLFAARMDKAWSLTDCVSFVVMKDLALTEALTTDHHFTQAGFHALLAQ